MNADDVEPFAAHVLERVRHVGTDDDDVTGAGVNGLIAGGEARLAGPDDPRLRIGMLVQLGSRPGLVVDEKERHAGTIGVAFERDCAPGAGLQLTGANNSVHGRLLLVGWSRSHDSRKDARATSRRLHAAFAVSASSASGSRSWLTVTVDLSGPLSTKVTFTRVDPSSQSKRAERPGCEVRSGIVASVSHSPRCSPSTNASNRTATGTATVLEADTAKPSEC